MVNPNSKRIITPFGLDLSDRLDMFNEPAKPGLKMVAYLYHGVYEWNNFLGIESKKFRKISEQAVKAFQAFGPSIVEPPALFDYSHIEDLPLAYQIKDEVLKGNLNWHCYPQVGFYDPHKLGTIGTLTMALHEPLHTAMTFLCYLWEINGSLEPTAFGDTEVALDIALKYDNCIGETYKNRLGVWHRDLVEPYNRYMVMWNAIQLGRDPIVEYKRFLVAGCTFYPEYFAL